MIKITAQFRAANRTFQFIVNFVRVGEATYTFLREHHALSILSSDEINTVTLTVIFQIDEPEPPIEEML